MPISNKENSRPNTAGQVGVVAPFTKPVAQSVWRSQSALGAYEDEKLSIYQKQLHDMGNVFEQARHVRVGLQAVYAERNQHVLDLLAELRADTDERTKVHRDRITEYAHEWEVNAHKGVKSLHNQLKHDLILAGRRYSADNKEITRLDEAIQQEVADCVEHTTSETAPIIARLAEHSDNLNAQIAERHDHHDEWCATLQQHFKELRARTVVEEAARKKQFEVINKSVVEEYDALNVIRDVENVSLREKCVDLSAQLKVQNVDREKAQVAVLKDMLHYMDQFEVAIAEMNRAQHENTERMENVKKKTGLM